MRWFQTVKLDVVCKSRSCNVYAYADMRLSASYKDLIVMGDMRVPNFK